MSDRIGIAKAARIINVQRSVLQKLIKSGQLTTFEGKVSLSDLKKLFPTLNIELDSMARDMDFIKKAAYSSRVQTRLMPTIQHTEAQIEQYRIKILVEQQKSALYSGIMHELLQFLVKQRAEASEADCQTIDQISQWLVSKLNNVE